MTPARFASTTVIGAAIGTLVLATVVVAFVLAIPSYEAIATVTVSPVVEHEVQGPGEAGSGAAVGTFALAGAAMLAFDVRRLEELKA